MTVAKDRVVSTPSAPLTRLGWWDTDLVDPDGGGDLLARLAPSATR
jgi:hypothetical protein